VGDGDTGPNTGGMGSYSPAPVLTPEIEAQTMRDIVIPTARAMCAEGVPFRGVLFAGLMIKDGQVRPEKKGWGTLGVCLCSLQAKGLSAAGVRALLGGLPPLPLLGWPPSTFLATAKHFPCMLPG
jgi:hypothetical protein